MVIEVALVLGRDRGCIGALVDDEDPIEVFETDAADEPLGDCFRPWPLNRCGLLRPL
jgi:hypothetical protein